MLNLSTSQQTILDSDTKAASWLFDVTDRNLNRYYWSTKSFTLAAVPVVWAAGVAWGAGVIWDPGVARDYSFKIMDFNSLTLARPKTEIGIVPPNEISFSVNNPGSAYSPDDFEDGSLRLTLMASDNGGDLSKIRAWLYKIKLVSAAYQQLSFNCEDFFQQFVEGNYPGIQNSVPSAAIIWATGIAWGAGIVWDNGNSGAAQLYGLTVHDVFPNTDGVGEFSDYVCIPLPFGTAYVPIRPALIGADWYYVIGPTIANGVAVTYDIQKVRSPRDFSVKYEYTETFTQTTKTSADGYLFQVFTAELSAAPTNGLYSNGEAYYDLPTKFTRSDTALMTNHADVLSYVLQDIGIDASRLDTSTFEAAAETYDAWGLQLNGAFWKVTTREKALMSILSQCHSTLVIGEKIALKVLDSTSVKTLTAADIIKPQEIGAGSFRNTKLTRLLSDSGTVKYSPSDNSQDGQVTALVATKLTKQNIFDDPLKMPFVQDGTIARNLARLYFQRKLLKKAEQRVIVKGTCLGLEPSDFVTITGDNYGGEHDVIIDAMTIHKDLSIDLVCTEFTDSIENYPMEASESQATLWTWGYNLYGQLGDGTIIHKSSPVQVGAMTTWATVAGGSNHSVAIKTDGTLWSWGYNLYGQLGDGTIVYKSSPVQVGAPTSWGTVGCCYEATLAVTI